MAGNRILKYALDVAAAAAVALVAGLALAPAIARADGADQRMSVEATRAINAARQSIERCTRRANPATPASARSELKWNPRLAAIADQHSRAMAQRLFFDHVDEKGRDVAWRADSAGYQWRLVGENIAAGQSSVDEAVRDWVASESHCRNLIDARYVEFGLARVEGRRPGDPYGVYWTLVLAQPAVLSQTASSAR